MSAFQTVQFRDAASVVRAYTNRGVPAFCIRNTSQLLFSYKGEDMDEGISLLTEYLDLLQKSESAGIYALCVFEELPKGGRITNKTEYDGSFNFRFTETISTNRMAFAPDPEIIALREEIKMMREEMEARQQDQNEESEGSDTLGAITKLMENPMVASVIGAVFEKIMESIEKKPQAIENVNEAKTEGLKAVGEIEMGSEVSYAYELLCRNRNDFPELLKKLALLSQKKPAQFAIYCTMLKSMKL